MLGLRWGGGKRGVLLLMTEGFRPEQVEGWGCPYLKARRRAGWGEGADQEPRSAHVQCGVPTKTPTGHVGLGVRGRLGGVGVHSAEALGWPCPGSRGPLAASPSASRELSPTQALPRAYLCRPAARPSRKRGSMHPGRPPSGEVRQAGVGMPSRLLSALE